VELVNLKALQSTYDTYIRLVNHEIPKLEAEMATAETKLSEANKGIDQVTTHLHLLNIQSLHFVPLN
jgi:hypothetical protein